VKTTRIRYKDVHDALRIETGEKNPEVWRSWFRNPFNNKMRISSKISRRQQEKRDRGNKRGREV